MGPEVRSSGSALREESGDRRLNAAFSLTLDRPCRLLSSRRLLGKVGAQWFFTCAHRAVQASVQRRRRE